MQRPYSTVHFLVHNAKAVGLEQISPHLDLSVLVRHYHILFVYSSIFNTQFACDIGKDGKGEVSTGTEPVGGDFQLTENQLPEIRLPENRFPEK